MKNVVSVKPLISVKRFVFKLLPSPKNVKNLTDSHESLQGDHLFDYNPSSFLHFWELVRPRPLIRLQSVWLLAFLDLGNIQRLERDHLFD